MPTLATTHPTLLDVVKRTDPDGSIAKIVELMTAQNGILEDMGWQEGNLLTGHRTSVRTGLPAPTWRKLYGGVQPGKSSVVQVEDATGSLEAYAEVDKKLADLNGNTEAFRISEDVAYIEGINQEFAQTLLYGNEGTAPEEFTGLSPRFNSLSAQNADNIISAGGSGADNTSIWLVVWGPQTVFGITPKGIPSGLKMRDMGEVTIENVDGAGGRMQGYRTHYTWDVGMVVRDWRYVVRIPNVDLSDLAALSGTQAITAATSILKLMIKATERIPSLALGRAVFYANRSVREALRLAILDKVANNLSWETVTGKRVMTFDDIPVRRTDALISTETVVS